VVIDVDIHAIYKIHMSYIVSWTKPSKIYTGYWLKKNEKTKFYSNKANPPNTVSTFHRTRHNRVSKLFEHSVIRYISGAQELPGVIYDKVNNISKTYVFRIRYIVREKSRLGMSTHNKILCVRDSHI